VYSTNISAPWLLEDLALNWEGTGIKIFNLGRNQILIYSRNFFPNV